MTYEAADLPTGASFDTTTQTFSWTPEFGQAGSFQVIFSVSDNGSPVMTDSEEITIAVGNVNQAPVLNPIGNQSVNEGELLEFVVSATDPDGDDLTYEAADLPTGASFDTTTQTFSWTPEFGQAGSFQVIFSVSDNGSPVMTDSEEITIAVGNVNQAPVLNPIGNQSVNEGELLEFVVSATDPDGDDLTYEAADLPTGASFDTTTQTFSWTPEFGQAGSFQVIFSVSDNGSPVMTDSEEITIAVGNVNQAPVLNPIGNQSVNEGELLEFVVTATNPDGDVLTFSAVNLPEGAVFDPGSQVFSWTPYWESSGEHSDIIFRVADNDTYDEESITIDVIDSSPLTAPTGLNLNPSANAITLTWDALSQSELLGYNIYRSSSNPGSFEKLNDEPVNEAQYIDNSVSAGTTYYYFVTAVDIFNQTEVFSEGLSYPIDVTIDDEGTLYAGSWTDGLIYEIDNNGDWATYASGLGTVATLNFHSGLLYTSDWSGGNVYSVDAEGYVSLVSGGFITPSGIAFNADGDIFIGEDTNGRILRSSDDGETWEIFTDGLDGVGKIIFNDVGELYVTEDILAGGELLGAINIVWETGEVEVLADVPDPDGICLDQYENLYVGQSDVMRLSKVMPDGNTMPILTGIAPWGCTLNRFNELIATLPWDGQLIKVHLSHESDISDIISATVPLDVDIIIDNTDAEVDFIGSDWDSNGNPIYPFYGSTFSYSLAGSGADEAVYSFEITEAGEYEVYAWWPSHFYCSTDTPYHIYFSDGATTVRVNQRENPAQWNLLASGYFEQGIHEIVITDDGDGVLVVADAVRIVSAP